MGKELGLDQGSRCQEDRINRLGVRIVSRQRNPACQGARDLSRVNGVYVLYCHDSRIYRRVVV